MFNITTNHHIIHVKYPEINSLAYDKRSCSTVSGDQKGGAAIYPVFPVLGNEKTGASIIFLHSVCIDRNHQETQIRDQLI